MVDNKGGTLIEISEDPYQILREYKVKDAQIKYYLASGLNRIIIIYQTYEGEWRESALYKYS